MTLERHLSTRGNAVTLLRLLAAGIVVFGHAWEVGGHGPDPLQRLFGEPYRHGGVNLAGEIGVNTFFALSGYLVTQSWLRSRSAADFARKRFRRIFPAFWACLALTGLALFPWLWARQHGAGLAAAYADAPVLGYVARNFLLRISQPTIGDLFAAHPAAGVANGALWSLFPEFLCYVGVALGGALLAFTSRRALLWGAALAVFALHLAGPGLLAQAAPDTAARGWIVWRFATQASFFAAGALWCVHAERMIVTVPRALLVGALSAGAFALGGYFVAAPLFVPPLALLAAAILPGAALERVGDFSYGIYLYHYPVQQALVALGAASGSPWALCALSLALVLPVAAASWFCIERPALRWGRAPSTAP